MLKSLRRKKTRDGQAQSVISSRSGTRASSSTTSSGRNFLNDVIVISTADGGANAPLAPPASLGLSPSPPSNPFARPLKVRDPSNSSHTSTASHGDASHLLGTGDKILPDENDFRSSLILPHLERRFSLLNTITPEDMRSQLRAQRARAQENRRPFLTEEEEEEIIHQLEMRIEANAKARGETGEGAGKLGILLPPINDHPWDSVIGRGTDGFGGHIPIYAVPAVTERERFAQEAPPLPSTSTTKVSNGSTTADQLSPTLGVPPGVESPPSPSRRENDDRAVGSLFSSRGARADAAYMRNIAKQRGPSKASSGQSSNAPDSSPVMATASSGQFSSADASGKPPVEPSPAKIGRESILSSARSSTSSNRPSMSALQGAGLSPSKPAINITAEDGDESESNPRRNGNSLGADNKPMLRQRQSRLLTTLSPEAFRRVSTALDELFDHFRSEAAASPVDAEADLSQGGDQHQEVLEDSGDIADASEAPADGAALSEAAEPTKPLSIRTSQGPSAAVPQARDATGEDKVKVLGEGTGLAMPGGLGSLAEDSLTDTTATILTPPALTSSPAASESRRDSLLFPSQNTAATASLRSRTSTSSANLSSGGSPSPVSPPRHLRTFSTDSYGSTASSMARYGLTPPSLPSKRTSSLPKRHRKSKESRGTVDSTATADDAAAFNAGLSAKQRGKQREDAAHAEEGSVSPRQTADLEQRQSAPVAELVNGLASGVGTLATAIGTGVGAVAAATAATAAALRGRPASPDKVDDTVQDDAGDETIQEEFEVGGTTPRSPTPRLGSHPDPLPAFTARVPSPPSPQDTPMLPQPAKTYAGSFGQRPQLEHTRGASTFSQLSFTSADTFRSAEEGGLTSGASMSGAKSSGDEASLDGRGSIGSHAFELKPDPLNVGATSMQPHVAPAIQTYSPAARLRALSPVGSGGGTSGRGSFIDDEIDDDEDAFGYDRRATLRPAPRSPESTRPGSTNEAADAYGSVQGLVPPAPSYGSRSARAGSITASTLHPSPNLDVDHPAPSSLAHESPSDIDHPSRLTSAQLGSPFPDVPTTLPYGMEGFRPPSSSGHGRLPVPGAIPATASASSHQRGASASSITSFGGEASLIGAQNIGHRRRSSTLAAKVLPPTSSAASSPHAVGSARNSLSSSTDMSRARSGSVDAMHRDGSERGAQTHQVAPQRPLADTNFGEPMNLAGPAAGARGWTVGNSGSSLGHQRLNSAAGTQLSFDPANGRIRVGPTMPNAYTFVPPSNMAGPPPVMMTHSASGTVSAPVIDSPQSASDHSATARYATGTQKVSQTSPLGPAPFEGPVPMMQIAPQPGGSMTTAASSPGQGPLANVHRRMLSSKGSNSSLNRNTPFAALAGMANALRPSNSSTFNGTGLNKTITSPTGVNSLGSAFTHTPTGSNGSVGQRSPAYPIANSLSTPSLSREPSDASHGALRPRPTGAPAVGPPSAYQTHTGATVLGKRPSDASLTGSQTGLSANHAFTPPPAIGHHASNSSISSMNRGAPASTTVLTAEAIAARNAHKYGPQYHRTRGRSNSGSSAAPHGSGSINSPAGVGLGFFKPSPPTTPASPGIAHVMAQQNATAASGGFRSAASAAQSATADKVELPTTAAAPLRRAPPEAANPPGFSFPARSSMSQDGKSSMDTLHARGFTPLPLSPEINSQLGQSFQGDTVDADHKSIRSVSDINASSEDETQTPDLARMSTSEDVWATVARNTSIKRSQGSRKMNAPGARAVVRGDGTGPVRKRSQDLLNATAGAASIPLHTDSSVLTAEQLAEIQTALARSESQRSNSRAGAASRQATSPPPVPNLAENLDRVNAGAQDQNKSHDSATPFYASQGTPGTGPSAQGSQGGAQPGSAAQKATETSQAIRYGTAASSTPGASVPTHIAARTPVLASTFKSEVKYDVTNSHRPTSPTFSHKSKRSDLPSLLDLTTQQNMGFRPVSPIHDLDEHALSLSQAIDEANARQIEFTFPAMTESGHRRGNSSIDSRFSGRVPQTTAPLQTQQKRTVQNEAIREESIDVDVGAQGRQPRRSRSHDNLTNIGPPPAEELRKAAASEAHLTLAPRLIDDVAAQTKAATRALKGPEENAALALPKRSRTLSKRKSTKKLNQIISQPALITTSQRLDHALDIKTPDVFLMRSPLMRSRTHHSQNSPRAAQNGNFNTTPRTPTSESNAKVLHRRHSSSFGNSGEFKRQASEAPTSPDLSRNGTYSPSTPTSSNHIGSRIFGKLRPRKRTGDIFPSPSTPGRSTIVTTKSPASSFGHATLGAEPQSMLAEFSPRSVGHQPAPSGSISSEGGRLPRNMSQADRENRLRLVSALSFGSPLDQAIGESIEAHLKSLPEEVSSSEAPLNGTAPALISPQAAETKVSSILEAQPVEKAAPVLATQPRPSVEQTGPVTKSARDTIVRRTIIIPTDTTFDKRKSSISVSAKRKSRPGKAKEDRDAMPPPSTDSHAAGPTSTDGHGKRDSCRRSVQDRPPTPPGPAGVSGLHRRKISADMLADQPLPKPVKEATLGVPTSNSQGFAASRKLGNSPSLVSLNTKWNGSKLAPPLHSPATTSVYSQGNGSLYDFYMGDDDEDGGSRGMQHSPSMDNPRRNHIEVTERADGSVVWQVIAGLADRSSMYSEDPRLSYLSGGSRTRESGIFRGSRVESVYVPDANEKTVTGLDPDDSRSFFAPKRGGHRKSFSYENHPVPTMPSGYTSSELTATSTTDPLAADREGRTSLQRSEREHSSPPQFSSPIGFDMATSSGPSTRIVYTNDADLAQLLESFAHGQDSAKFDFIRNNDPNANTQISETEADQSRQRVEAEIYTLLNSQALES